MKYQTWLVLLLTTIIPLSQPTESSLGNTPANEDIVIADFESESYGTWTVTGNAFGPGPATGTLPGQMHVDGYRGKRLVNSFFNGDGSTGTLISPKFTVSRKYISFLIGGGKNQEKLAIQLVINDKVVRQATGLNDQPGGSETLQLDSWDVSEFLQNSAQIRILDQAQGGWGHINVDQIVQTDTRPPTILKQAKRQITIAKRYLNIPIRNGAAKRKVSFSSEGQLIVRNDIELADDQADWWASIDMAAWIGKTVTIEVDQLSEASQALGAVEPADQPRNTGELYEESKRGQFHFSPQRGWNNDPNGLVYFNGEYHLFFQHNPYGWSWGNMHWGHAVSPDLIHWQELTDVLWPDEFGPMFSGSAVVDWENTSGFGKPGQPPMVLLYTAAGNPTVQCLAWSTDGRTFTKYDKNPVVKQITPGNRDPKVFWHAPTQKWIMVLYVELDKRHTIHFLTSSNLKDWEVASITQGDVLGKPYLYECPDFFELAIDDNQNNKKWVLMAADSAYAIGTFDGKRFHAEQSNLKGHRGRGFYAAQTFSDIPVNDGRRIQIGWWQTETRGMPFNQSMTVPWELRLNRTNDGPRVSWTPVRELLRLRTDSFVFAQKQLRAGDANPLAGQPGELWQMNVSFTPEGARNILFKLRDLNLVYSVTDQMLHVNDLQVPAPLVAGKQTMCILCDRTGFEITASNGLTYVPLPMNNSNANESLEIRVDSGAAAIHSLELHQLRSAWPPK